MAVNKNTQKSGEKPATAPEEAPTYQARVPADIRSVSFPVAMRGYDRDAVEAYVRRVNRVIAELEVTRSPQAAVRHAVERVSEQTKTILDEARESAEKITATAESEAEGIVGQAKEKAADLVVSASTEADRIRAESDELVERSKAEAEKIRADAEAETNRRRQEAEAELAQLQAEAEARRQDVAADTAKVWERRRELLGDIDRMAAELHHAVSAAAARLSEQTPEVQPDAETVVVAPNAPAE
jgi:DivIVA domain-containing protein